MKSKLVKLCGVVLAMAIILSLSACAVGEVTTGDLQSEAGTQSSGGAAAGDLQYNIAFLLKTTNNPFYISMQEGAEQAATELGTVNITFDGPQSHTDDEKQILMFENAITKGVDAICVIPASEEGLVGATKKANDAGIPVITIDGKMSESMLENEGASVITYIGSDNVEGGRIAGEYLGSLFEGVESIDIAVLEGTPGHVQAADRFNGFLEGIAKYPNINIVANNVADWDMEKGYNAFQNMLQANPSIMGLFAANDLMALGAARAVSDAGIADGEIKIVGYDATDDGRKAVEDGVMMGTVAQYPFEMGYIAVMKAVEALEGKEIEPNIPTKVEVVTKDNL